jgi:hypothetical protein
MDYYFTFWNNNIFATINYPVVGTEYHPGKVKFISVPITSFFIVIFLETLTGYYEGVYRQISMCKRLVNNVY